MEALNSSNFLYILFIKSSGYVMKVTNSLDKKWELNTFGSDFLKV